MSTQCTPTQLEFHTFGRRQIVGRFDAGRLTSDGGAILLREVDRRLGLMRRVAGCFTDYRNPNKVEHSVLELVTQRVGGIALGYEDLNDHDVLRGDSLLALWAGKADLTGAKRSRERDRGYCPRTPEEEDRWFLGFISVAVQAAMSHHTDLSERARELLAGEFRSLWRYPALRPALNAAALAIHTHRSWPEGWRAVRSIKYFDCRKAEGPDMQVGIELLEELDNFLQPVSLSDEVRTYVFDVGHQHFPLSDEFDIGGQSSCQESEQIAAARAHDLGIAVCGNAEILDELKRDLFVGEGDFRIDFGKGLASACDNPRLLWERLVRYFTLAESGSRNCLVLCGALDAIHERDEVLAKRILSDSVENSALRPIIVTLHFSVPMSRDSVTSFLKALDSHDTPLDQFARLASQRPPDALTEEHLREFFLELLKKPRGAQVVLNGLSMRIRASKNDKLGFGTDLKQLGLLASAAILRDASYRYSANRDYRLSEVLKFCWDDTAFPEETDEVFDAFLARANKTYGATAGLRRSIAVLAEKAPLRFLDGIFLNPTIGPNYRRELFSERHHSGNALDRIGTATLMDWCRQDDFQERLTMLSQAVHPFTSNAENEGIEFSELAHAMIDSTRNPAVILGNFANSIRPRGGSGSLAEIIARRCRPFEALQQDRRSAVRRAAEGLIVRIRQSEDQERRRERAEDQERNQRFE